jgi:hypothetical protein
MWKMNFVTQLLVAVVELAQRVGQCERHQEVLGRH